MGCKSSTTKGPRNQRSSISNEAVEFLDLAQKQENPVAMRLLDEWQVFVDAQVKRNAGDLSAARAYASRPREVWANTEHNPLTHRSVDYVGKVFLEYIKSDLSQRGWGGNFDYKVAGVPKQGFLKANANVDTACTEEPEEVTWEVKIHYYSAGTNAGVSP